MNKLRNDDIMFPHIDVYIKYRSVDKCVEKMFYSYSYHFVYEHRRRKEFTRNLNSEIGLMCGRLCIHRIYWQGLRHLNKHIQWLIDTYNWYNSIYDNNGGLREGCEYPRKSKENDEYGKELNIW